MPSYTGEIRAFLPNTSMIRIGEHRFKVDRYLYNALAKQYKLGDRVEVAYSDGKTITSVVRRTPVNGE